MKSTEFEATYDFDLLNQTKTLINCELRNNETLLISA